MHRLLFSETERTNTVNENFEVDTEDPFHASSDSDPDYLPLEHDNKKIPYDDTKENEEQISNSKKNRKSNTRVKVGRKRERKEEEWIDVKSKTGLDRGLEHTNRQGKLVKARKIGEPCQQTCRLECNTKMNQEMRQKIFKDFWNLQDHTRQWDFIVQHVTQIEKKQSTISAGVHSRRNFSRQYHFQLGGEQNQICKNMFLKTLGISQTWVNTALTKRKETGVLQSDQRGKHKVRPHRLTPDIAESVRKHIKLFPLVPSHYIRKDSKRMYLEEGLSIQKMYKLYTEFYDDENIIGQLATHRQYRDIFNTEFNISFFRPKKDQCDVCSVFNLADETRKVDLREHYERHLANKIVARNMKNSDKELALTDKTICVACFDLQKVLATPQSNVSDFYYKSKYATYNFTIFDIGNNDGFCYVWHEQIAKRGSNEVASCLWKFIETQKKRGIKSLIFYSDNCGGQNRNHTIFSMFSYAAVYFQVSIIHRFLEKGHTQNEGDSMHAVIENAKKRQSVLYVPEQWITLIRMAKTVGKVYNVTEMSQEDFLDFKSLVGNKNWKTDNGKGMIKISQIKEISTSYNTPNVIFLKYDLSSDSIRCDLTKAKRGRPSRIDQFPSKVYTNLLPIDKKKLTGLLWLCDTGKIPTMYHGFYRSLHSDTSEKYEITASSDDEELQ